MTHNKKIIASISFLLAACSQSHHAYKSARCTALPPASKILIRNVSQQSIIINRYQPHNPGMSAGWASKIDPKYQSMLYTPKQGFCATCTDLSSNKTTNCNNLLKFKKDLKDYCLIFRRPYVKTSRTSILIEKHIIIKRSYLLVKWRA